MTYKEIQEKSGHLQEFTSLLRLLDSVARLDFMSELLLNLPNLSYALTP